MRICINFFRRVKFKLFLKKHLIVMRNRKKVKNKLAEIKSEIADINYDFKNYYIDNVFKNFPINFEIFFRSQ